MDERPYLNPHLENEILQGKSAAVRFAAGESVKAAQIESMAYSERDVKHARRAGSPENYLSKKVKYYGLDDDPVRPRSMYLTGLERIQQGIDDAAEQLGLDAITAYHVVPGGDLRRIEAVHPWDNSANPLLERVSEQVQPYYALGQGPYVEDNDATKTMRVPKWGDPF